VKLFRYHDSRRGSWTADVFENERCARMQLSDSQDAAERSIILLVEDEDLLREMLEETLMEAGYGVVSAASGEEAADLLGGAPLPRALITDINLGRTRRTAGRSPVSHASMIGAAGSSTSPAIAPIVGPRTAWRAASCYPSPSRRRSWSRPCRIS